MGVAQVSVLLLLRVATGRGLAVMTNEVRPHTAPVPPLTHSAVMVYEVALVLANWV